MPDYKIEIEGRALDDATKGDVLELKVKMDLENLTSIDLTINNWDDRQKTDPKNQRFGFKYSDTTVFDPGSRIHVQMGYVGKERLLSMAKGVITTLAPRFPETGPPTLAVTALDSLVKLRDRKPKASDVKRFVDKSYTKIAEVIASRNGLKFESDDSGRTDEVVTQGDMDEAQLLRSMASKCDFDCYIGVDAKTGQDILFFTKPTDGRPAAKRENEYVFEWGENLIHFNPTLSIADQVGTVTVRGWNPVTKEPISYTATKDDLPKGGGGTSGPETAEKTLEKKGDIVVKCPVLNGQEARDLAISMLRERSYGFLVGDGQVIGLPDLRPGDMVNLQGLGTRFSGRYYVREVEHTLGNSGYLTNFKVRIPSELDKKKK